MNSNQTYTAIGLMSGTSLDGLDIAACSFFIRDNQPRFEIHFAETVAYPEHLTEQLRKSTSLSGLELSLLNNEIGDFFGNEINQFIQRTGFSPDFIASHGHTVFHQPERQLTLQIGSGAVINATTGIPVICDFRSGDVSLGGQGAPLVPIADLELFSEYDSCINLGGFANLSFKSDNDIIAYDICPCNLPLNYLAEKLGKRYDKHGEEASRGKIIPDLLTKLNQLAFYTLLPPKSLGKEWLDKLFIPLMDEALTKYNTQDLLRTVTEHISIQIINAVQQQGANRILITGGGAKNAFLIDLLRKEQGNIEVPDELIIDFKEALAFAYLGYKRVLQQPNALKSVTGAAYNNIGGAIYDVMGKLKTLVR
jgi:anhydro-N-acetylmuramic acid kinase